MKNFGFTLAETLITLGIIGVVAALTIPATIAKYKEKQTVTKVKSTYSILSQALISASIEHGMPEEWGLSGTNTNREEEIQIAKIILPQLKILKDCGVSSDNSCFYGGQYKWLSGQPAGSYGNYQHYRFIMANGVGVSMGTWSQPEMIDFYIDVNGSKGPNQVGIDLFDIAYYKNKGLLPLGTDKTYTCHKNGDGWGCTKFILEHENMNYPD